MYVNMTSHSPRKGQGSPWLSCNWSCRWPCGRRHLSVGGMCSWRQSVMSLWSGLGLARTLELLWPHPCCSLRDERVPPGILQTGKLSPTARQWHVPGHPATPGPRRRTFCVPSPASLPFARHPAASQGNRHGRRGEGVCLSLTGIRWPKGAPTYKHFLLLSDFENNICSLCK